MQREKMPERATASAGGKGRGRSWERGAGRGSFSNRELGVQDRVPQRVEVPAEKPKVRFGRHHAAAECGLTSVKIYGLSLEPFERWAPDGLEP